LQARIDPRGFGLLEATVNGVEDGVELSLEPCAAMYVVLAGLSRSMPQLPWVDGSVGSRIEHPGYEE
jgi:hypothetical protein